MQFILSKEGPRGCGYRKDGVYLVGDGNMEPCERLPMELTVCPCCGQGHKPSRGWTHIHPRTLFADDADPQCWLLGARPEGLTLGELYRGHNHAACAMCDPPVGRHGLMWVGSGHYSPESFIKEAQAVGVSKRIPPTAINEICFGITVCYLAHRAAVPPPSHPDIDLNAISILAGEGELQPRPGVFFAFKPSRVDIVATEPTLPDGRLTARGKMAMRRYEALAKHHHEERLRLVQVEQVPEWQQSPML